MNERAASLTAAHWEPIEPDTSSTSDRSTMRRVASPELVTVRSVKLASRMNVVGTVAEAVTVTVFTPVAALVATPKKPAAVAGSVTAVVPR